MPSERWLKRAGPGPEEPAPVRNVSQRDVRRMQLEKRRKLDADATPHPAPETAPLSQTAPPREVAPAPDTPEPLSETAPPREVAPLRQTPAGFTMVTHEVSDAVVPTLDVYSQSVLQRLLRLTWGRQEDTCTVGLPRLAQSCNISVSQARRAARLLAQRGFVEIVGHDLSSRNQELRGTTYRVLLRRAPTRQRGATHQTAPTGQTPNKEKALKERVKKEVGDCPDCHGTGMWYPEGYEKGVVKCSHKRLR